MGIFKIAIVAGVFAGGILLWVGSQSSVKSAECQSFDKVVADGAAMGLMPFVIPPDRLPAAVKQVEGITGKDYGAVTRGFMVLLGKPDAQEPSIATFGFEVGGCMLDPQTVPYADIVKKPGLPV